MDGNAVDLGLTELASGTADLTLGASAGGGGTVPYVPPTGDAVGLALDALWTGTTDLTLDGESDTAPPSDAVDVVVAGTFALRGAAAVSSVSPAVAVARFALRGAVSVFYDNSVFRGPAPSFEAAWDADGADAGRDVRTGWQKAMELPADKAIVYDEAKPTPVDARAAWRSSEASNQDRGIPWDEAAPAHTQAEGAWNYGTPAHIDTIAPWGAHALDVGRWTDVAYGHAKSTPRDHVLPWQGAAKPVHKFVVSPFDPLAARHTLATVAPWNEGKAVTSYGGPWVPYKPPPPIPEGVLLQLCALGGGSTDITLGIDWCAGLIPNPGGTLYILPARVYMAVHNITAHRLPDLAEIPIEGATLAADVGSFAWTLRAQGPVDLFELLAPASGLPAQLRITADGLQWVFIVESLRRTHEFGRRGVSIGGRSATALIGSPWRREAARMNDSADLNAQQLAAEALTFTGVGLDWGITDWLVPAGAWSHVGTPLAAVQAIAEAAGGYVQSHRSAPTLLVRHPYPSAPWLWDSGAADVELAPDAVITSGIERRDGPDINAVYVSGTSQGVVALVKRTGAAGDKLATMATDPLIVHVDAARQRGLAIVGAGGAKHDVQIELPVLTGSGQPGVLDVGQLVQINESAPWRGRVRAVSVQAGRPVLRQSVTLERHL